MMKSINTLKGGMLYSKTGVTLH
jgi:hypothetical protein